MGLRRSWAAPGPSSCRQDCHSAAPPSPASRCFDRDGEGVSAKTNSPTDGQAGLCSSLPVRKGVGGGGLLLRRPRTRGALLARRRDGHFDDEHPPLLIETPLKVEGGPAGQQSRRWLGTATHPAARAAPSRAPGLTATAARTTSSARRWGICTAFRVCFHCRALCHETSALPFACVFTAVLCGETIDTAFPCGARSG